MVNHPARRRAHLETSTAQTALSWAALGVTIVAFGVSSSSIHIPRFISLALIAAGGLILLVGFHIGLRRLSARQKTTRCWRWSLRVEYRSEREIHPEQSPGPSADEQIPGNTTLKFQRSSTRRACTGHVMEE